MGVKFNKPPMILKSLIHAKKLQESIALTPKRSKTKIIQKKKLKLNKNIKN